MKRFLQDRYQLLLSLALGFSLAASESRQYTAVFDYHGDKSPVVVLLSIALVAVCSLVAYRCLADDKPAADKPSAGHAHASSGRPLLLFVTMMVTLQTVALICQCVGLTSGATSTWIRVPLVALGESCYIVFVIIAILLARSAGARSPQGLIFAFATAGTVQLIAALLRPFAATILVCLLPLITLLLFISAQRQHARAAAADTQPESADAAPTATAHTTFPHSTVIFLVCIFLMGALLICTHAQRMSYQDGGFVSFFIQAFSGVAGVVVAIIFAFLYTRIQETTRITLSNLLVLTVLLCALYTTSLFRGFAVLTVLIVLHRFAYLLVYYFIWQICLARPPESGLARRFIIAFFVAKLGWAAGVLLFMTLPKAAPSSFVSALPVVFLVLLIIVDIYIFIRMSDTSRANLQKPDDKPLDNSDYLGACKTVAEKFELTQREEEVLAYLGRGRTASYIEKEMFISDGTVRTHINHIYKKMGIHNQQDLIDVVEETMKKGAGEGA